MKQVIFLCLLSLTLCLSKPTETEAPANHADAKAVEDAKAAATNVQTPAAASAQTAVPPVQAPVAPAQAPVVPPSTPKQTAPAGQPLPTTNTPQAENQKPNTIATTDDNKTTEKKDDATIAKTTEGASVETSTPANDTTKGVKPTPNNNLKPEEKGPKQTTAAPASEVPKTSDASKTEDTKTSAATKDEDKHIVQARGFDGPSFIGGIILSLGLLAIGFMGFKYYKNQTERNYHTL